MTNRQLKMNKAALFFVAAVILGGTTSVCADADWQHKLVDPNGVHQRRPVCYRGPGR